MSKRRPTRPASGRRRLALAALAVALVAAGCAGGEEERRALPEGGGWASAAELDWLRGAGRWQDWLSSVNGSLGSFETSEDWVEGLMKPVATDARRRYSVITRRYLGCGQKLAGEAGQPPTARLQRAHRAFAEVCRLYRVHARRLLAALRARDADRFVDAHAPYARAERIADATIGSLPPGPRQPLHELRGLTGRSRVEPELGRVAGRVAVKDVEVRCWSRADWGRLRREEGVYGGEPVSADTLGRAFVGGARIHLSPVTCDRLLRLRYERARPDDDYELLDLAVGVATLAHEATHAAGHGHEELVECYAVQLVERTAWALGVKPAYARRLAEAYWDDYDASLPEYHTSDCRDGGPYDLRPSTDEWP